ncbi:MAG: hypothetical protein N2691_01525 [Patescibacteria group bacterium]|nr:hypothetical protein [Patescibacteria group bacterium]
MTFTIRAALVLAANNSVDQSDHRFLAGNIHLFPYRDLDSLGNTMYHDVLLVHESFASSFKKELYPNSAVVLLLDDGNRIADVYPKAEAMGAFTILTAPFLPDRLVDTIRKAYDAMLQKKKQLAEHADSGKVVAVTSFSNGSGKSLLAYNLSRKLTTFFPDQAVSLIDMNRPFGIGKALLGVEGKHSWDSLRAVLTEGSVSPQKVTNITYATGDGFAYIAGPTEYSTNTPLSGKQFRNLADSLQPVYRVSILDLPTMTSVEDISRLQSVDRILITIDVTSTSVLESMYGLRELRTAYPEVYGQSRFVLNRVDESAGRAAELVASRLEVDPYGVIDEDTEAVRSVLEQGRLFDDRTLLVDSQIYGIAERLVKELF